MLKKKLLTWIFCLLIFINYEVIFGFLDFLDFWIFGFLTDFWIIWILNGFMKKYVFSRIYEKIRFFLGFMEFSRIYKKIRFYSESNFPELFFPLYENGFKSGLKRYKKCAPFSDPHLVLPEKFYFVEKFIIMTRGKIMVNMAFHS